MKKTLILILACIGSSLLAMSEKEKLNERLTWAVNEYDLNETRRLLDQGADPNTLIYASPHAPILAHAALYAIKNNNTSFEICRLLIQAGADKNGLNFVWPWAWFEPSNTTALIEACNKLNFNAIKFLIENGANPNQGNVSHITPLISLVANNAKKIDIKHMINIMKFLIENGTDPNQADINGNTPLMTFFKARGSVASDLMFINTLLTTIPNQEEIRKNWDKMLSIRFGQYSSEIGKNVPADIRKIIIKNLLDNLINEQMNRITHMLTVRNNEGNRARDIARGILYRRATPQAILDRLNPDNQQNMQVLRRMVKRNIRQILSLPVPPDGNQ